MRRPWLTGSCFAKNKQRNPKDNFFFVATILVSWKEEGKESNGFSEQ
jgi:hypothetical protein